MTKGKLTLDKVISVLLDTFGEFNVNISSSSSDNCIGGISFDVHTDEMKRVYFCSYYTDLAPSDQRCVWFPTTSTGRRIATDVRSLEKLIKQQIEERPYLRTKLR